MDRLRMEKTISRYEAVFFTVNRRLNALMREQLDDDITLDQFMVLQYIHKHGRRTSTELSDAFCVGKSAITALITRLVAKDYIARTPDEKDRRVIYLSLTDEGQRVHEHFWEKCYALIGSFLVHFNPDEIETFLSTFEKLARMMTMEEGDRDEVGSES